MPTSDSEDFESADEGHGNVEKKNRKLNSSSNSSDRANNPMPVKEDSVRCDIKEQKSKESMQKPEGLDTDKSCYESNSPPNSVVSYKTVATAGKLSHTQDGWDDFDDWGNDAVFETISEEPQAMQNPGQNIQDITERLAAASTNSGGWGWGWGVDSILSSATAGISNLTSQVSQGITNVLESGIVGAPNPEELARKTSTNNNEPQTKNDESKLEGIPEDPRSAGEAFPPLPAFGSLFSGVTKFVETTGTKVIHGGLDTLETIGKKTMEVLQDGDPGLAKKRAMLGLDSGDKPVLSQVLREAKSKAEEEDRISEEKRQAKEVHYESLFDDFEGLVHLEALEMLSKQVSMRIDERLRSAEPQKRLEIKETLSQVAELCEMPEEEDEESEPSEDMSKPDALHERLQNATQDLGLKLQFQPLVKQYTEILAWLSNTESDFSSKSLYKRAVSGMAQATSLCVEVYHKAGEMLLVKTRRSTADEADALTQMTVVLTKHISDIATLFTEKLNSVSTEDKDQINTYITNIFLEAGNSSTYIQNAFQLILPILQIGAV